jgi:hypothetical protein
MKRHIVFIPSLLLNPGLGVKTIALVHDFDTVGAAPFTSASGNKLSSLGLKMFNAGEAEDATGLNYS